MMRSNNPLGLLDVVCGEPVDDASVHRFAHAGALFCFCSDACLARFIVDPHQFVPAERSGTANPSGAGRPAALAASPPVQPAAASASVAVASAAAPAPGASLASPPSAASAAAPVAAAHSPTNAAIAVSASSATGAVGPTEGPPPIRSAPAAQASSREPRGLHLVEPVAVTAQPALKLEPIAPAGGSSNMFASLLAWREKRFAVRTCADLLKLHKIVAARNPGLAGPALYRQVVAARSGGDLAFADAVLENAEQSFAIWPVPRALKFADVVHYLAATEFLATSGRGRWIHADMKRIVAARVPHHL